MTNAEKTGGRRMNTQVMTFENQEFGKVRTVEISGEPWMVGKGVAK